MDAVVRERLEKWGFSGLIPQFRDNQIDEETFLLLDSDTLKELIPAIGPRMKFFKLFKDFTNPQQQHQQQQQNEPHPDEIQADEDEPIEEMVSENTKLKCFKCLKPIGGTKELFTHLHYFHNIHSGTSNTHIVCQECASTFSHLKTYKKHVLREHSHKHNTPEGQNTFHEEEHPCDFREDSDFSDCDFHLDSDSNDNEDSLEDCKNSLEDDVTLFVSQLKFKSLPETTIQAVVGNLKVVLQTTLSTVGKKIADIHKEFVNGSLSEHSISEVQSLCKDMENAVSYTSEHQRVKVLTAKGALVMPEERLLGHCYTSRVNRKTGRIEQIQKSETYQYVPMSKLLKAYLEQPGTMECIIQCNSTAAHDSILRSYRDGQYFQTTFHEGGDMIVPLLLYTDEFECANPLGSRKGEHKLCAFYVTILALPPKFQSTLNNILLVALVKSKLVTKYGMDSIMHNLVGELQMLYENGILISVPGFEGRVRPKLFQVVGDNLGLHTVLGFACGFTANFYCSACKQHRDICGTEAVEDVSLLRTLEQFEEDLLAGNFRETGVRRDSILNTLSYYHVTNNFVRDVMHDFLEGIVPLVLKLVIKTLIDNRLITLDELNSRILSFSYGLTDKKNCPSPITMTSLLNPKGPSGQKAAQTQCLLKYICLICGDKVPKDDDAWEVLCSLLHVSRLVMAPRISVEATYMLKAKIQDHLTLYQEVFMLPLTPKQHFLVHYPRVIRLIGPLNQYSSMRFEAKHKALKYVAKTCNNFIKIEKTLATSHQMSQSYGFLLKTSIELKEIEVHQQEVTKVSHLPRMEKLCELLHCTPDKELIVASSASVHGHQFQANLLVMLSWSDDLPLFGQIIAVLVIDGAIKLFVQPWKSHYFEPHYQSYVVTPSQGTDLEEKITTVECLADHRPVHAVRSFDEQDPSLYVATRFLLA